VESERVVLVGVDGSPQSRAAVSWAAAEAAAWGGRLVVVSVVDTTFLGLWTASRTVRNELRALAQPIVTCAIEQALARHPGLPVQGRVLLGPVGRTVLLLSRHADLVVVGRSGRGALSRTWLGSLAQRLLVQGHGTTVVVPPEGGAAGSMKTGHVVSVVLGVDTEPAPAALLRFAFETAARHDVPLRSVHAVSGPTAADPDDSTLLRPLGAWPAAYPNVLCSAITRSGEPGTVLLDACRPGDLLVVGRHDRAHLEPPRLGSVLAGVLATAPCPVAVVHPGAGS
jgi:nucleotide-binding universal stress UspA family protein